MDGIKLPEVKYGEDSAHLVGHCTATKVNIRTIALTAVMGEIKSRFDSIAI